MRSVRLAWSLLRVWWESALEKLAVRWAKFTKWPVTRWHTIQTTSTMMKMRTMRCKVEMMMTVGAQTTLTMTRMTTTILPGKLERAPQRSLTPSSPAASLICKTTGSNLLISFPKDSLKGMTTWNWTSSKHFKTWSTLQKWMTATFLLSKPFKSTLKWSRTCWSSTRRPRIWRLRSRSCAHSKFLLRWWILHSKSTSEKFYLTFALVSRKVTTTLFCILYKF